MATTIAKMVVGSKVKKFTKDFEGAVGLDEDDESEWEGRGREAVERERGREGGSRREGRSREGGRE